MGREPLLLVGCRGTVRRADLRSRQSGSRAGVKPHGERADNLKVTLTAAPAPVEVRAPAWAPAIRRLLPTVATGAALLWWGSGLVRDSGGRGTNALAIGLVLLAFALLAVRPWRAVPVPVLVVAVLLSAGALAVLPSGGVGRTGAIAAGAYVLGSGLVVLVGAWTSSDMRAQVLAAGIVVAGLAEFGWGFIAWWGGGDDSPLPMVGTFFWWNSYAAYLLAPALLGLALVVVGKRPWRSAAWIATPFVVAGMVLSTSRATLACLAVGWLIVGVVLVIAQPRRLAAAGRVAILSALSVGVTFGLTSPLLFRASASPLGATQTRGVRGETISSDGAYRLDFWREAVHGFLSNPFNGTGYGRILTAWPASNPGAKSALAHNGFLQGLAEGGLLLGVPLAVGLLAASVLLIMALRHPRQWGGVPFAAGVAGLGLLAHGLVDFDWSYPANVGAFALCVALAASPRWRADDTNGLRRLAGGLLVALVLMAGVLAVGQSFEIIHIDARTQPGATT